MGSWRLVLFALAVILSLSLFVPSGAGQEEASPAAPAESDGFVYFTNEVVGHWEPGRYDPICYEPLREYPHYGVSSEVPRDTEMEKAYTPTHYGPLSCTTYFMYDAEEDFTLGPGYQLTFWTGCDVRTAMVSFSERSGGELSDYAILITHEGEELPSYRGNYPDRTELDALCRSEDRLLGLEAPLDFPERLVREGDRLRVEIALFGQPSPPDNVYIATGSTEAPTTLHGPGLPGLMRDSPRSDLVVDVENRSARTSPGNATTYPVTVENLGHEERDSSVAVEGPGEWFAEPFPTTMTIPSNGTAEANLTVAAPEDAGNGVQAEHKVTITSGAEEVTFGLTTTVAPGEGTPVEEVPGVQLLDASEVPDWFEKTSEADADGGSFLEEFGLELAAAGTVALGAFLGRRFFV